MENKENNNFNYEFPKIILPSLNYIIKPVCKTQINLINNGFKYTIDNNPKLMTDRISKMLESQVKLVNESIKAMASSLIVTLKIGCEKLKDNQKKLAKKMIENGWYFTEELPININELLEYDNISFNISMSYFFDDQLKDIHSLVIKCFPDRKNILEKCFIAHENEEYELCIPTMLTQADGISYDIFNKFLFNKKDGIPLTKGQTKIKFDENSFGDIPYYIQLSITGQLNQNCNCPKYFNRHMVMHGKDINYAQKVNSLRCISIWGKATINVKNSHKTDFSS